VRTNELKAKLAAGRAVVGPLLSFNSPELVRPAEAAGFRFVLVPLAGLFAGPAREVVRAVRER
jgi:2-keto-3-deoxy-L-rhamnonate aldolase RhmA